jgi:hypothetical protein
VSRQERRESAIPALLLAEFALNGYYGTSAEAIAQRVSVTQPYLSDLPGKKAIVAALTPNMETPPDPTRPPP